MSGGGSAPLPEASAQNWVDIINEYQKGALVSRLGIPMIYGIDAVHGHNNVYNATIFPHNVGLGATRQVLAKTFIRSCMFPISVSVNAVYISSDDRFEFHRDPDLVKRIGAATAVEVRATGIPYTFAPCIAVNFLTVCLTFIYLALFISLVLWTFVKVVTHSLFVGL